MSSTITIPEYKGYLGSIEFDLESDTLHGTVLGIADVVTYEAKTLGELVEEFRHSVDDYLEMCEQSGAKPQRPYSGVFNARLGEERHRHAASAAQASGVSLNDFVQQAVDHELERVISSSP